jgi:hypothetical protein
MSRRHSLIKLLALPALCCLGLLSPAQADTVFWTNWTASTPGNTAGTASGNIPSTPVTVSYTGEINSLQANYPSWTPSSSYVGGTVSNAPPQSGGIIQITGGTSNVNTVTFSTPVTNPVMAIWSLGQGGDTAEFDFTQDEPFSIQAGGLSAEYNGQTITSSGSTVFGAEGNGTIQFIGTFSSLSWTNPVAEYWYGFTVGIGAVACPHKPPAAVPLPASLPASAIGMACLLAWKTKKSLARSRA